MHCLGAQAVHMWVYEERRAPPLHLQTCLAPPSQYVRAHMRIPSSAPAVQPPPPLRQGAKVAMHNSPGTAAGAVPNASPQLSASAHSSR